MLHLRWLLLRNKHIPVRFKKGNLIVMWTHLSLPWQSCLSEAWTAYCHGSLPIGSVVTDAQGQILARGRNRFYESAAEGKVLCGHRLAHAEMNALIQLEWSAIDSQSCILYTTTEPCPLCVGAIRMVRLGEVRYASRDGAAGSADLFAANAYMRRGNIKVMGPEHAELETCLVAMLIEFALTQADENSVSWCEHLATIVPTGAQLGQQLFTSRQLRRWKDEERDASFVFEQLLHSTDEHDRTISGQSIV